ncbi:MAG: DUF1802 family protein [bacterium]
MPSIQTQWTKITLRQGLIGSIGSGMAIAFKEWALVCEALGNGEQSILLRKGGIAEGGQGFGFEHNEFYLFPTWYHAQIEKVRSSDCVLPEQSEHSVVVSYTATVEWSGRVNDLKLVRRLADLHVLHESVIEERFAYDTGQGGESPLGIHVAFVRIYRLEPPVLLPMEQRFGGCRSWIELPEITPGAMVSVLSDEENERRRICFSRALGVSF